VYKIKGRYQFTVSYAVWDSAIWVTSSSSTRHKVSEP